LHGVKFLQAEPIQARSSFADTHESLPLCPRLEYVERSNDAKPCPGDPEFVVALESDVPLRLHPNYA
jgi:hypothetical protein